MTDGDGPLARFLPVAVLTVVLVGAIVFGGSQWGSSGPDLGDQAAAAAMAPVPTTADPVTDATADGVKRVVVLGDSLVWGARGQLTGELEDADVELTLLGGDGQGFFSSDPSWLDQLQAAVERQHPDVVVIEACCNVPEQVTLDDGTEVGGDSEPMYEAWSERAHRAATIAASQGATVHWVVTPGVVAGSYWSPMADRIARFNEIAEGLGVHLIDWQSALHPDGDVDYGDVRAPDGLHLTEQGSDVVVETTLAAIAPDLS